MRGTGGTVDAGETAFQGNGLVDTSYLCLGKSFCREAGTGMSK